MREWHVEHMQKTVLKYVNGLRADANSWEKKNHKKYGSLANICKQIEYDMRHGVTKDEVFGSFSRIHSHPSFQTLRRDGGAMIRLSEMEQHFTASRGATIPRWQV